MKSLFTLFILISISLSAACEKTGVSLRSFGKKVEKGTAASGSLTTADAEGVQEPDGFEPEGEDAQAAGDDQESAEKPCLLCEKPRKFCTDEDYTKIANCHQQVHDSLTEDQVMDSPEALDAFIDCVHGKCDEKESVMELLLTGGGGQCHGLTGGNCGKICFENTFEEIWECTEIVNDMLEKGEIDKGQAKEALAKCLRKKRKDREKDLVDVEYDTVKECLEMEDEIMSLNLTGGGPHEEVIDFSYCLFEKDIFCPCVDKHKHKKFEHCLKKVEDALAKGDIDKGQADELLNRCLYKKGIEICLFK
jgi:hypothetical protein